MRAERADGARADPGYDRSMPGEDDPARDLPVPPLRASDAERDAAMDALRDGAAEGRLTFEELTDRLGAAATAVTRDDLVALVADLPSDARPAGGAPDAWRAPAPAATPRTPSRRAAVVGDVVQEGPWRVPYVSRWSTVLGDITIDLREGVVAHSRIEIETTAVLGDITLVVPEGVRVEVRARAALGRVRQEAGADAPDGAPLVVLTGGTWFGGVRVRAERLRDPLADLGTIVPGDPAGRLGPGDPIDR